MEKHMWLVISAVF